MKVLFVCSGTRGILSPFIKEQIDSLAKLGIEFSLFQINRKGVLGYLSSLKSLRRTITQIQPDLIHAHYGLTGLLANLQRKVPVITTYHGSDINEALPYLFSKMSLWLSSYNIFVSTKLALKAKVSNNKKYSIISCGVDLDAFKVIDKTKARIKLGLDIGKKFVLFSSAFSNKVKNYPLASKAIKLLLSKGYDIELVEFKGFNKEEASYLMNAVDCVLVTSFKESGPLVIKEVMAVNICAVFVDVGDVVEIVNYSEGYYLAANNPEDIADKIQSALSFGKRTNGRKRIIELGLDSEYVAKKIVAIYEDCIKSNKTK